MRRLVIYKLELICVKYVPIIIALLSLLDNVLMYYDISLDILSYIAGTSILTTIPMYISSYVYKFCKYHRMFIHYIVVNKVIAMVDNYIIIPLSDFYLLLFNMIIKELSWSRKDLDEFIQKSKSNHSLRSKLESQLA